MYICTTTAQAGKANTGILPTSNYSYKIVTTTKSGHYCYTETLHVKCTCACNHTCTYIVQVHMYLIKIQFGDDLIHNGRNSLALYIDIECTSKYY